FALLLGVLSATPSAVSSAESRIGVAASTRPNAEGVVGTNSQALSPGSEVYANETVHTGNRGRADLVLLDNTNLIVESASEVVLDKFVYDRSGSAGSVVLQATRGTVRFSTGSQDRRAYQVNTPYGSLGFAESLANFVKDRPGEVAFPSGTSKSLAYAEDDNSRGTTSDLGGSTTVEVVVRPKGQKQGLCQNGRPPEYGKPCEVECDEVVRLVKGKSASFTSNKGKRAELRNANDVVCITPTGDIVHSISSESILSFEVTQQTGFTAPGLSTPTGGGNTNITCNSQSTQFCR